MTTPLTRRELRTHTALQRVDSSRTTPRLSIPKMIGDGLLWIAAAGGLACMALIILAFTSNITLIMFSTGSMAPTIPAGSVAVVQEVPASEISVGDIVTVDREGNLPVTHRVTSLVSGASDDERVLTMRGDANADEDPFPYTVTSARLVLFAFPGLATVIVAMGNPIMLAGITVAAAILVVWAFWPREPHPARKHRRPEAGI